ncbi:MAG: M48 family metalloprotease [Candidatus Omnitrophica bacterium]|nr:M48 family metalloprotease [Candidatus Omnitrophota bacterium]
MRFSANPACNCNAPLALRITLLAALTAPGCVSTSYGLATQRQEYSITSTEKEVEVGRKLARQVEAELTLIADEPMQARVRGIGDRLAAVCDRKELIYSFAVVEDKEVNAFSLPGGYVFVNSGLVKKAERDDELASVLAHEIAHIAARHSVKRFETNLGLQLIQLASLAAGREAKAARGVGVAIQAAQLAYARQDELEADRLAVRYLKAAGFDPAAALTFLEHLQEWEHDRLRYLPRGVVRPQYGMTHPFVPERIRAIKEELFGVADYTDYLNAPD